MESFELKRDGSYLVGKREKKEGKGERERERERELG
jgi:hypothetical protein